MDTEPLDLEPEPETPPSAEPTEDTSATDSLAQHEKKNAPRARHRARSQEASPQDVPRVRELTRRLRETEAELAAARGPAREPAAPAPKATPAPASPRETPRPPVAAASTIPVRSLQEDPEPDPAEYVDHPEKNYVKDQARWEARQEIRESNERATKAHAEATAQAEAVRLSSSWKDRTEAAKTKYTDFEAVAYAPTQIPQGSLVDAWILEHKAGADVLYHLQKNPTELHAMLALPLLDQTEALALLSQRLTSGMQAGGTGAAAPPPVPRAPRPPTPVRTSPQSTGDEPPGDDASLADHEKYYGRPRTRR